MPRLSFFHGIAIRMYWNERDHPVAHFHAEYAEHKASVALDGQLLGGDLPSPQLRLVRSWAALHQAELQANWEHGQAREPFEAIEPLA